MTSQAWPITIGKITLKDRKGPVIDRVRKNRIRTSAHLMAEQAMRVGKGKGRG